MTKVKIWSIRKKRLLIGKSIVIAAAPPMMQSFFMPPLEFPLLTISGGGIFMLTKFSY